MPSLVQVGAFDRAATCHPTAIMTRTSIPGLKGSSWDWPRKCKVQMLGPASCTGQEPPKAICPLATEHPELPKYRSLMMIVLYFVSIHMIFVHMIHTILVVVLLLLLPLLLLPENRIYTCT